MHMALICCSYQRGSILSIPLIFCVLYFGGFPKNADAESRFSRDKTYAINFSLAFSQDDIKLYEKDKTYTVDQRQISAYLINPVTPNIFTGLNIGSSYINMDNDLLTSTLSLNGNHIGFTLYGNTGTNPQLAFRGHALYQEARGSNALRTASLTWLEWLTAASIRMKLGALWRLGIEGGLIGIDAKRRVTGDVNDRLNLKQVAHFQGRLTIDLNTDPDGRISFIVHRGVKSGAELAFSRDF